MYDYEYDYHSVSSMSMTAVYEYDYHSVSSMSMTMSMSMTENKSQTRSGFVLMGLGSGLVVRLKPVYDWLSK